MKEKSFSEVLIDLRLQLGLTQKQMAKALSMSNQMYGGYERGDFGTPQGVRLAKYLRKIEELSNSKKSKIEQTISNNNTNTNTLTTHADSNSLASENELLKQLIKSKDELIELLRSKQKP